jgi:hypothetical protein
MKKVSALIIGFVFLMGSIYAQDKSQRKSPPMKTEGKIGSTEIVIDYSSPSVKGRKVYGELEPFGKIWRAGANEATTISFSKDVSINGKKLAAGKYAFFVIPMEQGEWTIIFNKEPKQWGAYKYDAAKDALRVQAGTSTIEHVEQLTYKIDKNSIHLDWSTTRLSFTVK